MAIKARASVTISVYRDTEAITRYYKLVSSTASAPSKPTTNPPSGWDDTEPSYTSGSTNTLYFCELTEFSDGTWAYSAVSKSSSYEAAKEAYNKAQNAQDTANSANGKIDGLEIGGRNLCLKASQYREDNPITSVKGTDGYIYLGDKIKILKLEKDVIYTVQCNTDGVWSKHLVTSVNKGVTLWIHNRTGSGKHYCFEGNEEETGVKSWQFKVSETSEDYEFRVNSYSTQEVRKFWDFKIEKGNKATDWTPAPEDVDAAINAKISSVDVEYYLSTSATSLSGGSWRTTAPTWVDGKYMWSRTKITDGAGNVTYSPSKNGTCIAGAKGSTGATGSAGKGVSSIIEQYYKSTSATKLSGGSWSTTYPGWENGKYIWTRSVITYTSGDPVTTTAVCVSGQKGDTGSKGDTGATGKGIKSSAVTYQASTSGTTVPTGTWYSSIPSVSAGSYLWTKTVITYTDNATTTSYSVGKMGDTGAKGDTGATGKGIKSTSITYQAGSSGTTAPTGTWETSPTIATTSKPYLWTRTIVTYTDNTSSTSYSVGVSPDNVVPKDGIVSCINQTPESITIQANKISLEGLITANNNFKILSNGSMETIAGKIGGWNIGNNQIYGTIKNESGKLQDGVYALLYDSSGNQTETDSGEGKNVKPNYKRYWYTRFANNEIIIKMREKVYYYEKSGNNYYAYLETSNRDIYINEKIRIINQTVLSSGSDIFHGKLTEAEITSWPAKPTDDSTITGYVKMTEINGEEINVYDCHVTNDEFDQINDGYTVIETDGVRTSGTIRCNDILGPDGHHPYMAEHVASFWGNPAMKCSASPGTYWTLSAFTSVSWGYLDWLVEKNSNDVITIKRTGVYVFSVRFVINSIAGGKRVEIVPFINGTRLAAKSTTHNTTGDYTIVKLIEYTLRLSIGDTVCFKIAPIDSYAVMVQIADCLIECIDYQRKY